MYDFIEKERLWGETDIICLSKTKGLFIFEVKSTFDGSLRLSVDMKKAYKQVQKAHMLFKIINSDLTFLSDLRVHKFAVFTNTPFSTLKDQLCKRHRNFCLDKDVLSSQQKFETFLEKYLEKEGLESGFSPYCISNHDLTSRVLA